MSESFRMNRHDAILTQVPAEQIQKDYLQRNNTKQELLRVVLNNEMNWITFEFYTVFI